jgi:short chain dehydrogenase
LKLNPLRDTLKAARSDSNYSPFLKHFGSYKVAKLDEREVTSTELLSSEIRDLKQIVISIGNKLSPNGKLRPTATAAQYRVTRAATELARDVITPEKSRAATRDLIYAALRPNFPDTSDDFCSPQLILFWMRRSVGLERRRSPLVRTDAIRPQQLASERVLLVTGGARGIGAATCRLGGARGYRVAVNYSHNARAAEAVVASIERAGGEAVALQGNVAQPDDVTWLFSDTGARLGPVTHFVNNAGITGPASRLAAVSTETLRSRALNIESSNP